MKNAHVPTKLAAYASFFAVFAERDFSACRAFVNLFAVFADALCQEDGAARVVALSTKLPLHASAMRTAQMGDGEGRFGIEAKHLFLLAAKKFAHAVIFAVVTEALATYALMPATETVVSVFRRAVLATFSGV